MRLRALLLVCCIVALLSGFALFTPFKGYRGSWLDAMFLVSVLVALLVGLGMLVRAASRSLDGRFDPGSDRPNRKND